MPTYDVKCSNCGHNDTAVLKIAELDSWDLTATCPDCHAGSHEFCRVINQAPSIQGGAQSTKTHLESKKNSFGRSAESDSMRHNALKRANPDQNAEGREIAKRGDFEGF